MADTKDDLIGKKIQAVPNEGQEIGIDLENTLSEEILNSVENSTVDMNSLQSFSNVSQTRESIYTLIDTMAEDDRVSAILETYAEDVVETNDKGQIVWCESSDKEVNNYVSHLLDVLNIDKHAYEWAYSFVKYGDLYLQLFRKEEDEYDIFAKNGKGTNNRLNESKDLKEDVNLIVNDDYVPYEDYVEMKANPGEMFELTRRGKTMGYIEAPSNIISNTVNNETSNYLFYKMKESDVNIYAATEFVHASLYNNNSMRSPEEVTITVGDDESASSTYKVRKGQSILYNQFRTWRELSLLENSVLLNRLTKSALVRILNIEIGDMPKHKVPAYLDQLKSVLEQKTALQKNKSIQDYTNPGPVENIIYVPVHNGQGAINATTLGGDYDPKQLTDLDYFINKFYGSLRVPKQYFNQTDDSTGFNGGTSLAIISSRYGKEIKQIQNLLIQMFTDLINLFLINRGYENYINKFRLRMQTPVTQEELDRKENMRNGMGVVNDIMQQVSGVIDDPVLKVKILKSLLSQTVTDPEVITILQQYIDESENPSEEEKEEKKDSKDDNKESRPSGTSRPSRDSEMDNFEKEMGFESPEEETTTEVETSTEVEEPKANEPSSESSYLPTPDELGFNAVDNI